MRQETFNVLPPRGGPPSHASVTQFLSSLLPPAANDVNFLYHTPRHPAYDPSRTVVSRVVLSIAPTPGVYAALNTASSSTPPLCVLHRPWQLDRRAVPKGTLVIASHTSLDMYLTVGWNITLAGRLGLHIPSAVCIQGYKGDPQRRIGIVAKVRPGVTPSLGSLTDAVRREFAGAGDLHLPAGAALGSDSRIAVVAIMNAFHPDEINRVVHAAKEAKWIGENDDASNVLYLTGAARDYGLEAAAAASMPAICVGHRSCEEWGVRFLAETLKEQWPELSVEEVLEEEEPRAGPKKAKNATERVPLRVESCAAQA
ncbi:ngg1p interacting factor 3 nif3 [Diplodia corticola]|uniref:Ngg1p interacting factor 3 nif3 n=1 Tax=Diplodia corticola TaxID=236234 RepID=A0A1J9RAG0_9PEZI|nr:ngg1p interacting factor 3 nif3 [Diplodia corticola]OJD37528.1 ngg1p interacting factor 3 nif3 [Diplodia corticola]